MLLTLGTFSSGAGISAREHPLRHPRVNVFRRSEERLSDTYGTRECKVAHGLCEHQPMKVSQLQLWSDDRGETHAILHKIWNYLYWGSRSTSRRPMAPIQLVAVRTPISRQSTSTYATLRMSTTAAHSVWRDEGVSNVHHSPHWVRDNPRDICEHVIQVGFRSAFGLKLSEHCRGTVSAVWCSDCSRVSWF
jgi:hypothetical protein